MFSIADVLSKVLPSPSAWRLMKSGSGHVDVGTPIARVFVSGTGGTLYMGMGDGDMCVPYVYGGAGGGVGIGLEIPVTAGVSLSKFPSSGGEWGRLYVPPGVINVSDINKDTICGSAVLLCPSASFFGPAGCVSVIFFGARYAGPTDMTSLMRANAIAFQAGTEIGTPSLQVSITLYNILIGRPGKIFKST